MTASTRPAPAVSVEFREILLTQDAKVLMASLRDVIHEMESIPSVADTEAWFSIIEQRPDAPLFAGWLAWQRNH